MLRPGELLIHAGTPRSVTHAPVIDGVLRSRGAVPRDYSVQPREMFDSPDQMVVFPQAEWAERIADKIGHKSQNSDIRLRGNDGQPMPSLDQDGVGYCWSHSTTQGVHVTRAVKNLPFVPLSAFAVAATIKKGANEGGWGGLSAQFARERGIPAQSVWPQGDRNYRKYDKPETWASAAKHKLIEEWVDLTRDVYDQTLTFAQVISCALSNLSGPVDFNWWSHSVCLLDAVNGNGLFGTDSARRDDGKLMTVLEYEIAWGIEHPVTAGFGIRIWNSWTDGWSDRGMGVLSGQKAIPDGALAIRSTTISLD